MDSELIPDTEIQNLPLTQNGKSKIRYAWGIFFDHDVNEPTPFSIKRLAEFVDFNFPWKAITDEMTFDIRIMTLKFPTYPGKEFSIFAKIQYGIYNYINININVYLCRIYTYIHCRN